MVKKEIKTAKELKKELEESKAKLALLNKKSRHSVKSKPKKKRPKKKTEVKRPEIKKLDVIHRNKVQKLSIMLWYPLA